MPATPATPLRELDHRHPLSETMADSWRTGAAKELERQDAALVQPERQAA